MLRGRGASERLDSKLWQQGLGYRPRRALAAAHIGLVILGKEVERLTSKAAAATLCNFARFELFMGAFPLC